MRSYSNDLIHGITRGKLITLKHFLLGLGLHNLTGQKVPVQILSHLGHSIDYNVVCTIETAEAIAAQEECKDGGNLKIKPTNDETILIVFWADNFNMQRDTVSGKTFLDITNIVAFQENDSWSALPKNTSSVPKSKQRSIPCDQSRITDAPIVDAKKEPTVFSKGEVNQRVNPDDVKIVTRTIKIWCVLRYLMCNDQTIPMLSGWLTDLRNWNPEIPVRKTHETFLPPITTSITEYGTIFKLFQQLQELSMKMNMPYVNVTMDVGAAMTAYKVLWNFPNHFKNEMHHLGDFHFMKENFAVIGKIVSGSGFEDAVFQASLCSSGCLNGVMNGSHYNRCWSIHEVFYECLERLLLEAFANQTRVPIPEEVRNMLRVKNKNTMHAILEEQSVHHFLDAYESYKSEIRKGEHGKTAQYWLQYYQDIMHCQHIIHTAIQENNYDLRRYAWEYMLPFYFSLNKTNYARYGSFYVKCMENTDSLYPGNRELIEDKGLSVQGQGNYALRTAIDQRGEQTINRDAKVAGGIKSFSADEGSIFKWTLNRAQQAENTACLRSFSNIDAQGEIQKQLQPSSVLASEKKVQKLLHVLTSEYINPFDPGLDKDKLYNLSSGTPVCSELAREILDVLPNGKKAHQRFIDDRLESTDAKFHDPIKRQKLLLFSNAGKKLEIKANGK